MERSTIRKWLETRKPAGSKFGTQRVEALLEKVGNPEKQYPIVHVTGTNGKGSTTTYIQTAMTALHLKVGSFSSPPLTGEEEQITIDGQQIPPLELDRILQMLQPFVLQMDTDPNGVLTGMTDFELLVVVMFIYFAEQKVDLAVVEVGLGGTLDATNVFKPVVAVITTIALDHMAVLGTTLEEIAAHKAGIMKPHTPVVVGRIAPPALCVIEQVANEKEATLYRLGVDVTAEAINTTPYDTTFTALIANNIFGTFCLQMKGRHQVDNALLALQTVVLVCERLNIAIHADQVAAAFQSVHFAGRLEIVSQKPLCYLDGAHNPAGMNELMTFIEEVVVPVKPSAVIRVVLAVIQGKDIEKMLNRVLAVPSVEHVYITTFDDARAYRLADLNGVYEQLAPLNQNRVKIIEQWQPFVKQTLQQRDEETVLFITGSLYFLAQVREFLLN